MALPRDLGDVPGPVAEGVIGDDPRPHVARGAQDTGGRQAIGHQHHPVGGQSQRPVKIAVMAAAPRQQETRIGVEHDTGHIARRLLVA